MGKLIVSESLTLDGVYEGLVRVPAEKFKLAGWAEPYSSEEQAKYLSEGISGDGTLLLGRATYQYFEASWSPQTGPVADFMNNARKYVVSNTLKKAEWNNSTLITGNVVEQVAQLKQEQDIAILGSGILAQSLIDLIDEYSFLVYPVVLGSGKRFFADGSNFSLKLKEARAFGSGVVLLSYVPDRK